MTRLTINTRTATYLSELAAEVLANGNPDGDIAVEMQAAHERRAAFAREMLDGKTERSRIARRVICANVYSSAIARSSIESVMGAIEQERNFSRVAEMRADLEGYA